MAKEKNDDRLRRSEIHYRSIYENSPVSFWEEDLSGVKKFIEDLRKQGISDLRRHFDENPQSLVDCYSQIKILDVNQETLSWYGAETKEELIAGVNKIFTEDSERVLKEELIALSEGKVTFRSEMYGRTLKGNDLHTEIFLTIVPGYEDTWEKVLICDIDITARIRLEKELKSRSERQTALRTLSQNFIKDIELPQYFDDSMRIIEQSLELKFAVILEYREKQDVLSLRNGTDAARPLVDRYQTSVGKHSLYTFTLRSSQAVVVDDLPTEQRFSCPPLFADHHLVSGVSVLIGNEVHPWGVLAAFSKDRRVITEDEVNFLESVARLLSMAIERSKVQEQQRRLVAAVDQTAEIVIITDPLGNIQYANPVFEKITGSSVEDILGQNVLTLNNGQEDVSITKEVKLNMEFEASWSGQFIYRKEDDARVTLETTISPVRDRYNRTRNFVAVMRDITGYLELENRLRHSQKVQAIGTLAGGIAHDFNNILAGIIGFAELAEDCAPDNLELLDILYEINLGARRAKELVQQILAFSRKGEQVWKPLEIEPIVQQAIKLLRNAIPATISIESKVRVECGMIQGNESQIHQVIINLCSNGYQAMLKQGGTLEILVDEIQLDEKAAAAKDLQEGSFIRIVVSDTGHGMDAATMARIFEPYFTTREVGLGSGLGLSTVLGIVETHGGKVSVESVPDQGSQFEVLFPAYNPESDEKPRPWESGEPDYSRVKGDGEHILFVDDEEPILKFSKAALRKFGYRVTALSGSIEALDAFRKDPDSFDLVISDQIMPNMTGMDLARQILEIRPEIPVILSTGFSEGVNREEVLSAGLCDFYMKPITSKELGQRIHLVLANRMQRPTSGS
ncbi:MAG: PAS domain S-box protein [Verrucomicrobiae bacterium]|nr:PAS domain S-box protein [Verrucomicrobiae bacterium]